MGCFLTHSVEVSIVHTKNNNCISVYYNLPNFETNRLQQIQNLLARAIVKYPRFWSNINFVVTPLHRLEINERIDYKLSVTYKVLTIPVMYQLLTYFSQLLRPTTILFKEWKSLTAPFDVQHFFIQFPGSFWKPHPHLCFRFSPSLCPCHITTLTFIFSHLYCLSLYTLEPTISLHKSLSHKLIRKFSDWLHVYSWILFFS